MTPNPLNFGVEQKASASLPSSVRGGDEMAVVPASHASSLDAAFYEAVIQRCVNGVAAAVREFSEKDVCSSCGGTTWSGYGCGC